MFCFSDFRVFYYFSNIGPLYALEKEYMGAILMVSKRICFAILGSFEGPSGPYKVLQSLIGPLRAL